jgi:hypothetical protein
MKLIELKARLKHARKKWAWAIGRDDEEEKHWENRIKEIEQEIKEQGE